MPVAGPISARVRDEGICGRRRDCRRGTRTGIGTRSLGFILLAVEQRLGAKGLMDVPYDRLVSAGGQYGRRQAVSPDVAVPAKFDQLFICE